MKALATYIFPVLFLLAICTPLAVMQLGEEQKVSLTEKRKLAERPVLSLSRPALETFPADFEAYFNDHFGLRNQLVKLYNAFFVTLFQTTPKLHTVVGRDKWLFLAADFVVEDFMGLYQFDYNRLQHWKQILLDRQEWLADKGIRYLFIAPPNKIMIYPEYLPDRIRKRQGNTNLQQFIDHLAKAPRYDNILDLRPALMEAKSSGQLYYKGDTHWNLDGAYVAYVAIMNRISGWFPELSPVPKSEMKRTYETFHGDLTYTLNLAQMYAEQASTLRWTEADKIINYEKFAGYPQPDTPFQKFKKGELFTNENPAATLTAVFISDSFGSALRDFLAPHFKRIIFVRNARFEDMKLLIETEKPDIVLDLNVARALRVAMGENTEIRDYILQKHMHSKEMLLDITADNLQENLVSADQLEFDTGDSRGAFTANGPDPQLYFSLPERTSEGRLNIHCQVTSSAETFFKVYYQTDDHQYYSEKKKVYHRMKEGQNSLYMRIYEPVLLHKLRIDPAEVPGGYEIERLIINAEPGPNG